MSNPNRSSTLGGARQGGGLDSSRRRGNNAARGGSQNVAPAVGAQRSGSTTESARVVADSSEASAEPAPFVGAHQPTEAPKRDSEAGTADEARRAASANAATMASPDDLARDMEMARINTISLKRVESEPEVAPLKLMDQLIFSTEDGYRQAELELLASGRSTGEAAESPITLPDVQAGSFGERPMDKARDAVSETPTEAQSYLREEAAVSPRTSSSEREREESNCGPKCPKRYRIALFAWESLYSVAVGGVAPHVTELAAGLERRGHEVHVFVRSGAGQAPYERIDGVYVHRCSFDLSPDFVKECENMCNSFMHAMYEVECFMNAHFDVIHCHDWLTGFALTNAKHILGRPVCIFTIHSTEYGRSGNNHYGGQSARIRDIEQAAISAADRIICVSGVLCDEVKAVYSFDWNKLRCVHNGINALRYDGNLWDPGEVRARYAVGPLDPMVLFVGRMAVQKGPDLLVEAAPFILKARSDTKFVMVGDGYMKPSLEARCHQLGVAHAFRWTGTMGGAPLVEVFKACDVVCVPSRNEPFGIVVLEAWASGKPVVVTKNGGPREFVTHEVEGYQIDTSPDSIAWGICKCFENFDHSRFMGEQGRKKAQREFSWDRIAELTNNVYDELLLTRPY
jgi:glycosyltransferase involved in cell wall biosynthesis